MPATRWGWYILSSLTGIALQSRASNQPVVTAVTLPSGETIDLRQLAAH